MFRPIKKDDPDAKGASDVRCMSAKNAGKVKAKAARAGMTCESKTPVFLGPGFQEPIIMRRSSDQVHHNCENGNRTDERTHDRVEDLMVHNKYSKRVERC
jgi:hypothetical protein